MNLKAVLLACAILGTSFLAACGNVAVRPAPAGGGSSLQAFTAGMQLSDGFLPFYYDAKQGKVLMLVENLGEEFIYVNYLARGVGSNDLGLDRGQLGSTRIVRFERAGPRVLLVQPNYDYRASSDNASERRAIEESFASSVLWGFPVQHEENGRLLIDASGFLARDAHGISRRLRDAGEGNYQLDPDRSAFYPERSRAFVRNTELEYIVTFGGQPTGEHLETVVPSPDSLTVHMHHSFVQLPDDDYVPRPFDPRAGYFGIHYNDYAAPIDSPLSRRFIARHRLSKVDPAAATSAPVKPIVYYVDAGVPSPIREALVDGASWWNEAFAAAGYKDAFRVEILPEGVDPLDVRYNVIQWVHRSTRGWSYGASVIDPRTGEIIKGHVSLGSLRVRQDFLLAEGLLMPYGGGLSNDATRPLQALALARLRQLSAHEVGHTLGLNHNFAASVQERASVMDYPHPLVSIAADGSLDISKAYAVGVGLWDKFAIKYGYQDFSPGEDEAAALDSIVQAALKRGQLYMVDADARTSGAAHPLAHLWDNGSDAVKELERLSRLREHVMQRFSVEAIPAGAPLATLEEVLVPVYLMHRYQIEAAAKVLGGQAYSYALRGDGQGPTQVLDGSSQRKALKALLATLEAEALALPEAVVASIPGRPPGYSPHRELFQRRTGTVFDAFGPAEAVASMTVALLLEPQRANRLVTFHALDSQQPGLEFVLDQLVAASWKAKRKSGQLGSLQSLVDHVVLDEMMRLAVDPSAGELVREKVYARLTMLASYLDKRSARNGDSQSVDHYRYGRQRIARFLENPRKYAPAPAPSLPPGSPIGDASMLYLFR